MSYQIFQTCDACNNCKTICPVDDAVIAGDIYRIDDELCVDCGLCVDECPTASIYKPKTALAA